MLTERILFHFWQRARTSFVLFLSVYESLEDGALCVLRRHRLFDVESIYHLSVALHILTILACNALQSESSLVIQYIQNIQSNTYTIYVQSTTWFQSYKSNTDSAQWHCSVLSASLSMVLYFQICQTLPPSAVSVDGKSSILSIPSQVVLV